MVLSKYMDARGGGLMRLCGKKRGARGFMGLKRVFDGKVPCGGLGASYWCEVGEMRNRAMKRRDMTGEIRRGEVVVIPEGMGVLLTDEVLDSILKMAAMGKKTTLKK
jgi:hypothetical protein